VRAAKTLTKLSSTVESKAGHCTVSTGGAYVEDILALIGGTVLSKELDSLGTASIVVEGCGVNSTYLQRDLHWSPE
jgi:hypothetical protein